MFGLKHIFFVLFYNEVNELPGNLGPELVELLQKPFLYFGDAVFFSWFTSLHLTFALLSFYYSTGLGCVNIGTGYKLARRFAADDHPMHCAQHVLRHQSGSYLYDMRPELTDPLLLYTH